MTKIKICGLRRPEDIAYVNEAKPDFAGFIIDVPKSRRNVPREKVWELTALLSPEILPVGVFVNAPMETILSLVTDGTLKAVQLHGQESQSYLEELKKQGNKGVHLLVSKTNEKALRVYGKLGFVSVGECQLYGCDFWCYERSL